MAFRTYAKVSVLVPIERGSRLALDESWRRVQRFLNKHDGDSVGITLGDLGETIVVELDND